MDYQDTARAQLRNWLRSQLADLDETALPDLTQQAVDYVKASALVDQLLAEQLRPIVYAETQQAVARTRTSGRSLDRVVPEGTVRDARQRFRDRFSTWLQHVDGKQIRLPEMTGPQCFAVRDTERAQGEQHFRRARFWNELGQRAGADKVGSVLKDREIAAIYDECHATPETTEEAAD